MVVHSGEFKDDGFIEAVGFDFVLKHALELWVTEAADFFCYLMPSGNMVTVSARSKFFDGASRNFGELQNWLDVDSSEGVFHYRKPFRIGAKNVSSID